jgi:1,4-alpha-glucan branching enzyme
VEEMLKEAGVRFFFVDSHGILLSTPRPRYGIFAPVYCPSGVAAFGRDMESSKSVWSSEEGYPGDYRYREFYRDIGFDLDMDYIKPYIHQGMGIRKNTGIKYYRVTSKRIDLSDKQPYDRDSAMAVADAHAGNFMFNREGQIKHLYGVMGGKRPIVISPYDAELYGHWWYEGPEWLDLVLRKIAYDSPFIELTTPYEYLQEHPVNQVATPSFSSWGYKGYAEFWLDGSNDWIYPHLHKAADRMVELANRFKGETRDSIMRRVLNQSARELLLAQSSDWAFIMKTGTTVEYAVKRTKEHIGNFNKIYESILSNSIDLEWLSKIESKNNIFPEIDYEVYCSVR